MLLALVSAANAIEFYPKVGGGAYLPDGPGQFMYVTGGNIQVFEDSASGLRILNYPAYLQFDGDPPNEFQGAIDYVAVEKTLGLATWLDLVLQGHVGAVTQWKDGGDPAAGVWGGEFGFNIYRQLGVAFTVNRLVQKDRDPTLIYMTVNLKPSVRK